jgi:polysaccharide export outer membrane protein
MDTEMKLNVMSFRQLFKFLVIGILALLLFACASNSKNLGEIDEATDGPPPIEGAAADAPSADGAGAVASKEDDASFVQKAPGYLIQPGDVLSISVWNEEELQREVTVRPDGGITFPLIGDLHASGKSIRDLRAEITKGLSTYIPEAAVSLNLKQVVGNKVNVLGQVKEPGEFILTSGTDVLQALSMAGGVTAFANHSKIKILRRDKKTQEQTVIPFNYKKVLKGRGLKQNILLQSGDTIVVP